MQSFTLPNPSVQREPLDLSMFDGTSTLSRADSHGALGQRRQNLPHIVAFWEKEQRDEKAAERGEPIDDSLGSENRRPLSTVPEDSPRSPIAGIDEVLTNALAAEANSSLYNNSEAEESADGIDSSRTAKNGIHGMDGGNRHESTRTDTTVSPSPTMFADYNHSLARARAMEAIQAHHDELQYSPRTPSPQHVPDDTFTTPLDSIGLRTITLDDSLMNISSATTLAQQAQAEPLASRVRSASSSYPSEGARTPSLTSDPASPSRNFGRRVFSSITRSPGRISSLLHCYTDSSSGANSTDTRQPLLPLSGVQITESVAIEVNNRSEVDGTDFGETTDIRHEPEDAEIDTLPPSCIRVAMPPSQSGLLRMDTSPFQPSRRPRCNFCLEEIGTVCHGTCAGRLSDAPQVADSRDSMTCLPRRSCVFEGEDGERTDDGSMLRLQPAANDYTTAKIVSNTSSSTCDTTDGSAIRASSIAARPGTPAHDTDTLDAHATIDLSNDAPDGHKSSFAERVKRHKSAASLCHCIRHSSVGSWFPRRKTAELERSNKPDTTVKEQRHKSHPEPLSLPDEPNNGVTPLALAALVDYPTGDDETQLDGTWLSTNTTHMTGALPIGARKSGAMARFKDRAGKVGAIAKVFGKRLKAKMHL